MADHSHITSNSGYEARSALTCAPLELNDLAMRFMGVIHTAQFELNAFGLECGMDPACWQALGEHVAHRRKIDQVNAALVLADIPGMGVPEDISFDLLSGPNDFKESGGVFQP